MRRPPTRAFPVDPITILGVLAALCIGALVISCAEQRDSEPEGSAVSSTAGKTRGAIDDPPIKNVILITLDTLRADHVGVYGYERATTPNLDQFARHAVVFERAISQASSTRASHQSLFQSRPASAADGNGVALAEVLAKNGFRTAAYTGGGNISGKLGFARGFEIYEEDNGGLAGSIPKAASWVRKHRHERFFLFLHTYDIHLPYDPPEPHASMFTASYDGPIRGDNTRETLRGVRQLDGRGDVAVELDGDDRERIVALYDGGLHYTDAQLVHFFNLTKELDLDRDTLVIFFSDHGEEFWDHGSVIHSHTLYRELLHVPLLLRAPGIAPSRIAAVVPLMDLGPTILELLGVPLPSQFEGRSLLGLISGTETADRPVISEQRNLKSWLEYPFKLVRGASSDALQLFDLAIDPLEQDNVAVARSDVALRLGAQLDARIAGYPLRNVPELEPGISDPELLERLRALGYIE
jgi:arylsulfatase A-like enzyme